MKIFFLSIVLLAFSTRTVAGAGDVDLSVPHIHDTEQVVVTTQNASTHDIKLKLKPMDTYLVFLTRSTL
ncbi:hypothetical protein RCJ22_11490 [Vibrio sp. FNV 38]|nr:hypothetical protein [Vibrio sp. FNV 38]